MKDANVSEMNCVDKSAFPIRTVDPRDLLRIFMSPMNTILVVLNAILRIVKYLNNNNKTTTKNNSNKQLPNE